MREAEEGERSYHCTLLLAGAIGAFVQGGGTIDSIGSEPRSRWVHGGDCGGVVLEECGNIGVGEEGKV